MASGCTSIIEMLELPIGRFFDIYVTIAQIIEERNKNRKA